VPRSKRSSMRPRDLSRGAPSSVASKVGWTLDHLERRRRSFSLFDVGTWNGIQRNLSIAVNKAAKTATVINWLGFENHRLQ
jgi:hypothetical protein